MANIVPPEWNIRHIDWTLDRPAQVNRMAYSGARSVVANPWHGKWTARVELAPIVGETNVRAWRSFLAKVKGQINTFELPATEASQHATGTSNAVVANRVNTTVTPQGGDVYRITKSGGSDGTYDADATTATAMTGDLAIWINPRQANKSFAIGVNTDPATDSSFASIDRALLFDSGGITYHYESGVQIGAALGSYTASDNWFIRRVGSVVTFLKGPTANIADASVIVTPTALSSHVHLDSSFAGASGAADVKVTYTNASATIASGGTAGATTAVLNNAPELLEGMMVTITLPSGNKQLVMLTADISGSTITFEPSLRESAAVGAVVETADPFAQVALVDSMAGWGVDPGQLYGISFDVEEAF